MSQLGRTDDGEVVLQGNTDGTLIGNTGNRLNTSNTPVQHAPNLVVTGSLTALNSVVSTSVLDGMGTVGILLTGTWVGTVTFQGSIDGTTFVAMNAQAIDSGIISTTTTANGSFRLNITGLESVRIQMTSYTSGTAAATLQLTPEAGFARTMTTLVGGTTGAQIGNVSDRLKVDASITVGNSGSPSAFSKKLRFRDMNVSNGGVARGTTITTAWTTVYSRTGSGLFTGLTVNGSTMTSNWQFRFVIDGDEIFTSTGLLVNDMNSLNIYNLGTTTTNTTTQGLNVAVNSSSFFFTSPAYAPIAYSTSISVLARTSTGTKTFNAGLIVLTEET